VVCGYPDDVALRKEAERRLESSEERKEFQRLMEEQRGGNGGPGMDQRRT